MLLSLSKEPDCKVCNSLRYYTPLNSVATTIIIFKFILNNVVIVFCLRFHVIIIGFNNIQISINFTIIRSVWLAGLSFAKFPVSLLLFGLLCLFCYANAEIKLVRSTALDYGGSVLSRSVLLCCRCRPLRRQSTIRRPAAGVP